MRFVFLCIVVLLIISSILAAPGVTPATQNCGDVCPLDYQPICGGPSGTTNDREKKSFGNNCVMKKYNCEKGENLVQLSEGECPGSKSVRLQ